MGVNKMLLNLLLLISSYTGSAAPAVGSCGDFLEGACDLSEDNIVSHDRFTNTAAECQSKCKNVSGCSWFTHFDTQCYLLSACGDSAHCEGCVSGPSSPDLGTCPWPPGPATTTQKSTTTYPTTPVPTTQSTTPTTTTPITNTPTKPTTTKPTTTTTIPAGDCNDIAYNELCDWDEALIEYYEHVMDAGQCQNICRGLHGARFFSHYNKEKDYYSLDKMTGVCGCFSSCHWPTSKHCHKNCDDVSRDSDRCHCMRGPLQPDVDSC